MKSLILLTAILFLSGIRAADNDDTPDEYVPYSSSDLATDSTFDPINTNLDETTTEAIETTNETNRRKVVGPGYRRRFWPLKRSRFHPKRYQR
ncbi:unnamed protein product [Caenorhabditis bovis]|uniref:Secreted protein n=1 Tax=Caenorhabditis bovis TaxID=2654633 RepID=A0A8S1F126_9PELO|nr:unnamed protein product [Caenorhabditis bovis]